MHIDGGLLFTALTILGTLIGGFITVRKGVKNAIAKAHRELQQTKSSLHDEMKSLLDVREREIDELKSRIKALENQLAGITELYNQSLSTLQRLQLRNEALSDENQRLRDVLNSGKEARHAVKT